MTCGDFLRLDNQLLPIKEIERVVQDHGYGLDHITIRLDGKSGDAIRRYFSMKVDGSWSNTPYGYSAANQGCDNLSCTGCPGKSSVSHG